jgi:uncharacterized protein YegP (UPF0339 family)
MAGYYELKRTDAGYHVNLKAGNHQVILSTRPQKTREEAMALIDHVRQHATYDNHFDRKDSVGGQPFFNLVAPDGTVLGSSEMYESPTARDNGIDSVKTNGASDVIKEIAEA